MSRTGAHRPVPRAFGEQLRQWRERRRMSQLGLSAEAGISTRHLSFVETGRSQPSREMVLRLSDRLQVPLRERNALLVAAGFAPMYRDRPLDHPSLAAARRAVELVLTGHEPYPALAVDRHWTLVAANRAAARLLDGIEADMLAPPLNVLRLSLHPRGLAPRIVNLSQWRGHVIERLAAQVAASDDPMLAALLDEVRGFAAPTGTRDDAPAPHGETPALVVPLRLRVPGGVLNFIGITTVFGSPVEVTLAELAIESFFPADDATAQALRALG